MKAWWAWPSRPRMSSKPYPPRYGFFKIVLAAGRYTGRFPFPPTFDESGLPARIGLSYFDLFHITLQQQLDVKGFHENRRSLRRIRERDKILDEPVSK